MKVTEDKFKLMSAAGVSGCNAATNECQLICQHISLSFRRLRVNVSNLRLFTFKGRVHTSPSSDMDFPHCSSKESPSVPFIENRLILPLSANTSSFSECVAGCAVYASASPPLDLIVVLLQLFLFFFSFFFKVRTFFLCCHLQTSPPVRLLNAFLNLSAM